MLQSRQGQVSSLKRRCLSSALCSAALSWVISIDANAAAKTIERADFLLYSPSVLKVEAKNANGTYSLGTAVTIAENLVVTNCHVTRNALSITLVKGALRWQATAQLADVEHDLCLLNVPKLESPPVALGSVSALHIGQPVAAMGYTGGVNLALREGTIKDLFRHDKSFVIQSSTAFTSGASGGALFDADGKLIGILTFRMPGPQAYYFSAPVDWFINKQPTSKEYVRIAPLEPALAFWERNFEQLPFFMQSAILEINRDWRKLLTLALHWSASDPNSPEPEIARGKALMEMEENQAAVGAFKKAIDLEPRAELAWLNLALLQYRLGNMSDVTQAYDRLKELNEDMAENIAATAGLRRH